MRSAQRNTYLTGFCLFLSLVLTRTFYIILDLIHTQEEYAKLKNSVRPFIPIPLRLRTHSGSPQTGKSAGTDQIKQIEELKRKLAAAEEKTKDYGMPPILPPCSCRSCPSLCVAEEIVKKQAEQNAKEYDRLATEFNQKTGSVSDKRRD